MNGSLASTTLDGSWPTEENDSVPTWPSSVVGAYRLASIVILSLLYMAMSLVCVVGNTLIIWFVFKHKKFQFVTNYFICNLAVADIVIGVLVAPFQVTRLCKLVIKRGKTYYFLVEKCHFNLNSTKAKV